MTEPCQVLSSWYVSKRSSLAASCFKPRKNRNGTCHFCISSPTLSGDMEMELASDEACERMPANLHHM